MPKFSKEVLVDVAAEPTILKLTRKARWSWNLTYKNGIVITEESTIDPIWALPQGALFIGILNPEGVEVGRISLQREGRQFQPIFYRTTPSEGVTLRMGPRWHEQHDIESVRSRQAAVYGVGLVKEDGGTEATLMAAIDGVFGPCPDNCIISDEIERCLGRG